LWTTNLKEVGMDHFLEDKMGDDNDGGTTALVTEAQHHLVDMRRVDEIYLNDELIRRGKLSLTEEINPETFATFRKDLLWCATHDVNEIEVEICSQGGQVFYSFAFFDLVRRVMKEFNVKINTLGIGFMASGASILFQAGYKRLATENSWYMIHEIQTVRWGEEGTSQVRDEGKLRRRIETHNMWKIYTERSDLKESDLSKWEYKEWWLPADEMLKRGLCDEVISCNWNSIQKAVKR